ncbi:MAG: GAF domain-containing protein [Pleurocapsa sp. SU_5_0]|nr:GAF domain-containing protein [Pleurocapsa sp. SU_5_0]NJR45389.1 GAF domain-containing protein [Hyellaceae cyanobacterium CSU_1_1]
MSQDLERQKTQYQNLKQIFKDTVQTTRQILRCDRVFIYDATDLPRAKVLAESVDENCTSILGKAIHDPFLTGDYLEMYCYGMSLTIDDIYTLNASKNQLQELEKLGVKSVAVAPIHVDNKLLAFLVAHQCFQTQPWVEQTVDLLSAKASAAGEAMAEIAHNNESNDLNLLNSIADNHTQHHPPANRASYDKNRVCQQQEKNNHNNNHKLFAEIKSKLTQPAPKDMLKTIVADIRQLLNCDRILIYSLNVTNYGVVVAESVADGWTKVLARSPANSPCTAQYLEEDRNGKVRVWNNTQEEDAPSWYREQLEALDVKAGLVAPIAQESQLFGLLIAHQCSDVRSWQQPEINWITQIANYIGNMPEYTQIFPGNQPTKLTDLTDVQVADVQKQFKQEGLWIKHFTDVLQQIRQSFKIKDILKSSVREVHRILNCDRVVIYSLHQKVYGKIVAESVSPGWKKTVGIVIQDPCFEAKYLKKYRDGRVTAWNNIYEAGMSSCYIQQLEQLEVKANLIVPIMIEGKLFGLLVVHQCSNPRRWEQSEILWLTQIAVQIGFALDNAQLLADAQRLRQQAESEKMWTGYFTDAVQQIRQSLKQEDILQASVREVRRILNCDRVVVYALDRDNYGKIVAESVVHGWTRAFGRIIKDPCFEARYLDQYRDGRVRAWENIYEAGMSQCYVEQLAKLEVRANLVTPIIHQGNLLGLLVAHQCSDTRQWQQAEIRWMTQIATQVGLALDNAQLLAKVEQYTKNTQEILERAVNNSANIQRTVQTVTEEFATLNNSCQNFAENIEQIKDLSKQLAQKSMKMTRSVNLGQMEVSNQDSVVELSDQIFALMQELFEATAKIDPLFTSIKTEITDKTATFASETEQLMRGVEDFQTASQKLEQVVALNRELSNLISNISNSLDTQIQGSTFTQNSVADITNITQRIAQQSLAIITSLSELRDGIN